MSIYLPSVDQSFAKSMLQNMVTPRAVNTRFQMVKLVILTLGDILIHTFAATTKLAFTAIQLPLYPLFGSTSPRVSIIETGKHTVRALKLIIAVAAAAILILIQPHLVLTAYRRLGLIHPIPAAAQPTMINRIHQAFTRTVKSPGFMLLAIGVALGLLYLQKSPENATPQRNDNASPKEYTHSQVTINPEISTPIQSSWHKHWAWQLPVVFIAFAAYYGAYNFCVLAIRESISVSRRSRPRLPTTELDVQNDGQVALRLYINQFRLTPGVEALLAPHL